MRLDRSRFLEVVRDSPLVSIDLVVRDDAGRALLGYRVNAPARNTWFVSGLPAFIIDRGPDPLTVRLSIRTALVGDFLENALENSLGLPQPIHRHQPLFLSVVVE